MHTPTLSKIASTSQLSSPSSVNSPSNTTSPVTSPKGERDKREKIIDEILSTEKDYIDSLRLLNEVRVLFMNGENISTHFFTVVFYSVEIRFSTEI